VRVGVLSGTDDVAYLLGTLVYGVFALQAKLCHKQIIALPINGVEIVVLFVEHYMLLRKISSTFAACGFPEGLPHACLDKRVVNGVVTTAAGFHTHVLYRIVVIVIKKGIGSCAWRVRRIAAMQVQQHKHCGYGYTC